ncbi:hypothetical protein B0H15DRAFT_943880 [Mycena belliarum]|uniref:Uncharacterized protein n=1 Tax=Mycena belliarum TaxID=1033014 RepID=A0AAD6XTD0_9AGAR|nr:hypothetical protein B0H15DRAFT_943880 [Mycena belliae]
MSHELQPIVPDLVDNIGWRPNRIRSPIKESAFPKLFHRRMFFRTFTVSALVLVAAATDCPVCPPTDLVGDALVAQSGGTRGTPRFCGYSSDATGASGPSVDCFFSISGSGFSTDSRCPTSTTIGDAC